MHPGWEVLDGLSSDKLNPTLSIDLLFVKYGMEIRWISNWNVDNTVVREVFVGKDVIL